MALGQQSGGDNAERVAEAKRIFDMGLLSRTDEMSHKEAEFVEKMYSDLDVASYGGTPFISAKKLFWLRDLKDRFCT